MNVFDFLVLIGVDKNEKALRCEVRGFLLLKGGVVCRGDDEADGIGFEVEQSGDVWQWEARGDGKQDDGGEV